MTKHKEAKNDKGIQERMGGLVGGTRCTVGNRNGGADSGRASIPCLHAQVDRPGDILGETCLNCGLYLNNGM